MHSTPGFIHSRVRMRTPAPPPCVATSFELRRRRDTSWAIRAVFSMAEREFTTRLYETLTVLFFSAISSRDTDIPIRVDDSDLHHSRDTLLHAVLCVHPSVSLRDIRQEAPA